jgi:asparagine synthase (glutamine-hydrolysing)
LGGLAGYLSPGRPVATLETLAAMLRTIRQRGPDDEGLVAIDRRRGARRELGREATADALREPCPHELGLAQCRLATVDASAAGHQPFWNESRSAVLVCDGEVYNQPELREQLEKKGHRFRSRCDAELVLRAYEEWDLEGFARLNGCFAVALYDVRRRRLALSRDRIGKSPLYFGRAAGVLYFASEIRALRAVAGPDAFPVDPGAVADFVLRGWRDVDGGTFYRGIRSLDAASTAVVGDDLEVRGARYWRPPQRRLEEREIDLREACESLRDLLADALRVRLRGEASIAMELSGGLASSALVALRATAGAGGRFPVYHARPEGAGAEEEALARQVAARFPRHVDHRVIRAPRGGFFEEADRFVALVGEPFPAPSLLETHRIRRRLRELGHGVVIVGSGGDEILAGDPGEYAAPFLASLLRTGGPFEVARELAAAAPRARRALARRLLRGARPPAPHPGLAALVAEPGRVAELPPGDFEALRRGNSGPWKAHARLRAGNAAQGGVPIRWRAPFLDYRLAELAFQLPATYLIRRGVTKYALRRALEPLLPPRVVWRRRPVGDAFPWRAWLAAAKPWILANAAGSTLACVRADELPASYDALAKACPQGLWRLASALLWHRRCNEGRPLPAAHAAAGAPA